jgi:hypothetical protein
MTDTDAHADKIGAGERFDNRSHAAVSGVATAAFDAQLTGFQIHLVVNHDQPVDRNLVITQHRADRFAAAIVERLRHQQDRRTRVGANFRVDSAEFAAREFDVVLCRQMARHHKARVVARSPILIAVISQPGDQPAPFLAPARQIILIDGAYGAESFE